MPILTVPYYYGLRRKLTDKGIVNELIDVVKNEGNIDEVLSRKKIIETGENSAYFDRVDTSVSAQGCQLTETQRGEVFNIIGDDQIAKRIINDLEVGSINLSGNPLNSLNITAEQELKALLLRLKKFLKALRGLGFEKQFSGLIWDVYNDFTIGEKLEQDENNKRVHRFRFKVDDDDFELNELLTLKKKDKENLEQSMGNVRTRTCYEIEYLIQNFRETIYGVDTLGLQPSREKIKYRQSFYKKYDEGYLVVADIDFYCGMTVLVELEISRQPNEAGLIVIDKKADVIFIENLLQELGLSDNELFHKGSRKLFEKYGIPYRDFDTKKTA